MLSTDNNFDFDTCLILICRSYFNDLYNDTRTFI